MKTVVVLCRPQMGEGERELGEKLLGACLRKLQVFPGLEAVVLYNSGVHLVARESVLGPDLLALQERGVELLPCGTCIEYYGLGERLIVDRQSNMDEILATLRDADKVITL